MSPGACQQCTVTSFPKPVGQPSWSARRAARSRVNFGSRKKPRNWNLVGRVAGDVQDHFENNWGDFGREKSRVGRGRAQVRLAGWQAYASTTYAVVGGAVGCDTDLTNYLLRLFVDESGCWGTHKNVIGRVNPSHQTASHFTRINKGYHLRQRWPSCGTTAQPPLRRSRGKEFSARASASRTVHEAAHTYTISKSGCRSLSRATRLINEWWKYIATIKTVQLLACVSKREGRHVA